MRKTADLYGWKLTGKLEVCEDCAGGKMKQANVSKEMKEWSKMPGERLFMDISSVRDPSFGGRKVLATSN